MRTNVDYKFVIVRIRSLVCDSRRKTRYIEDFDHVIKDIFGVNQLARKIDDAYNSQDVRAAIDRIGIDYLVDLFKSTKMYDIMADLVAVSYRLRILRKSMRKASKKGRRDKEDLKEFKYLQSLYSDAIKYVKKALGVQSRKTMYKRKYRSLSALIDRDEWDDTLGFSSLLDEDDFWDDEEDLYDDYDDRTELDDFYDQISIRPKRSSRSVRSQRQFDFDVDEEDSALYDPDLYDRVDQLTDVVADLSSGMQQMTQSILANKSAIPSYTPSHSQLMPIQRHQEKTGVLRNGSDISFLQSQQSILAKQVQDLANGQAQMNQFLREIISPEDDESFEDEGFDNFDQIVDHYNGIDIPHTPLKEEERISREEMVDMINASGPEQSITAPSN